MSSNTNNNTNTNNTNHPQNGIDIRKAMEILAARTPHHHDHEHDHDHDHQVPSCCGGGDGNSGQLSESVKETLKTMGQTIDLLAPAAPASSATTSSSSSPTPASPIQNGTTGSNVTDPSHSNDTTTTTKNQQNHHQEQIQQQLKAMSVVELLQTVLSSQEERVKTYHKYEQSLQRVLLTGNLSDYPSACTIATASFAVISDTIRAVQKELEERVKSSSSSNQELVVQSIRTLQSLEREKLQFTAACHLERIRERNQREENEFQQQQQEEEESPTTGRRGIRSLLQEGIQTLQAKLSHTTEQINDVIDEIRCALVDEMDDDEEE